MFVCLCVCLKLLLFCCFVFILNLNQSVCTLHDYPEILGDRLISVFWLRFKIMVRIAMPPTKAQTSLRIRFWPQICRCKKGSDWFKGGWELMVIHKVFNSEVFQDWSIINNGENTFIRRKYSCCSLWNYTSLLYRYGLDKDLASWYFFDEMLLCMVPTFKIARNSVSRIALFLAIENYVSNDFWSTFVDSIIVFDCRLSGVIIVSVLIHWISEICKLNNVM